MSETTVTLSRRDRKREATRRDIYQAAMQLFAEKSFGEVTISEICEAADVGRGTFFLHFPTKAALLYEFNERVTESFREALVKSRDSANTSARDELQALVERMAVELAAQAEIMKAMLAEFFTSPETLAVAPKSDGSLADLVTEIIERGQQSGEFETSLDAQLAAAAFLSTAMAFISRKLLEGYEVSDEEIFRQFLHLTFHGLGAST